MRARLALYYSGISCELREVVLKNKPQALLDASSKGTVPVLLTTDQTIDESLDIMHWALTQSDPDNWLSTPVMHPIVERSDDYFVHYLNRYKYFDRFPEQTQQAYLEQACVFIDELEQAMQQTANGDWFLLNPQLSAVDIALFPFVRQFAFVDKPVFDALPFPNVQQWLATLLESSLFVSTMNKYKAWEPGQDAQMFGIEESLELVK